MIEIDLQKLDRGTRDGWVTVHRGSNVFRRRQRLGQKEEPSKETTPPNPKIMEVLKYIHSQYRSDWDVGGITELNEKTGEFTYDHGPYNVWDGKNTKTVKPQPVHFRIEGNTVIREPIDLQVTIPESEINKNITHWLTMLDGTWGNTTIRSNYMQFIREPEKYNKNFNEIDNFTPMLRDESEGSDSKYSKQIRPVSCANSHHVVDWWVPNAWYSGNPDSTALVGEAVQEVLKGNYNSNNVVQQQIPLMIKASKKVNELHGNDTIYRGETNIETAQDILKQIDEFGDADIADKLFSCTENERLAKWYASTHNQKTARGEKTKSHLVLKIPREKFGDNVIMDYRTTGSATLPEEEVTIVGNDMTLTGDDVMIQAVTPKRKTKKWMTFTQFKTEGGLIEDLISQMEVK